MHRFLPTRAVCRICPLRPSPVWALILVRRRLHQNSTRSPQRQNRPSLQPHPDQPLPAQGRRCSALLQVQAALQPNTWTDQVQLGLPVPMRPPHDPAPTEDQCVDHRRSTRMPTRARAPAWGCLISAMPLSARAFCGKPALTCLLGSTKQHYLQQRCRLRLRAIERHHRPPSQ